MDPQIYRQHYLRADVAVVTVQAHGMHAWHPLHRERHPRELAIRHVIETLELADRLDCRQVLTVCGFGHRLADSPFERALDFFDRVGRTARREGVRLLVEPLSRGRAAVFNRPQEVVRLLEQLDDPETFDLALDTGHLLDGDLDPREVLAELEQPPRELQIKGPASSAPTAGSPLAEWLDASPVMPAVVAVEHRAPTTLESFLGLAEALSDRLSH